MSQNKEKMELSIGSVNINVIVPLDQQKLYTDACELVNNRLTEYQKVQNAKGLDYQLSLVALELALDQLSEKSHTIEAEENLRKMMSSLSAYLDKEENL